MKKFLVWLKGLSSWVQIVTTLILAGSMLTGSWFIVKKRVISNYEEAKQEVRDSTDLRQLRRDFDTVMYTVNKLSEEVQAYHSAEKKSLEEINSKMDHFSSSFDNLRSYMLDHSQSKDDILEILEIFEAKKNSENSGDKTASGG